MVAPPRGIVVYHSFLSFNGDSALCAFGLPSAGDNDALLACRAAIHIRDRLQQHKSGGISPSPDLCQTVGRSTCPNGRYPTRAHRRISARVGAMPDALGCTSEGRRRRSVVSSGRW